MKKALLCAFALIPCVVFGQFPSIKSSVKNPIKISDLKLANEDDLKVYTTKQKYKDFELYFEFSGKGEGELLLDEELSVKLDYSYGEEASSDISGSLNGEIAPILNASTESGIQKVRVSFQKLGKEKALLSVWLNDKLVQKSLQLKVENDEAAVFEFVVAKDLQISSVWTRQLVEADHRKLLQTMNDDSFKRGEKIYSTLCVTCHGTVDKVGNMPTALRFNQAPFKNGNDIVSMYDTVTNGFGLMVPQKWMKPQQVYDVIHYIREEYLKKHNKSQYIVPDQNYLALLPLPLKPVEGKKGKDDFNYRDREVYKRMDYGNALSYSYQVDNAKDKEKWNIAYKGFAQRVDTGEGGVTKGKNWILFEKDTMRIAAVWSGKFIDYRSIMFDGSHGTHPKVNGEILFTMPNAPAWAKPGTDNFTEVRLRGKDGIPYGPLPNSWAKFKGRYIYGDKSVLNYSIGDADILESVGYENNIYIRHLNIGKSSQKLIHRIAPESVQVKIKGDGRLSISGGYHVMTVPAEKEAKVSIFMASKEVNVAEFVAKTETEILEKYTKGGPSKWQKELITKIKAGEGNQAYTVDEIVLPHKNPWNSWMRLGGFDFNKDGDSGAICTWDGDIWTFKGLLSGEIKWKRMASGLFQPLGLKIIKGQIFVTCRDQVAIIKDFNNDGEADFIECFNSDHQVTDHFHEFAMGLQADDEGNLYYAKSARHAKTALVPQHGTLMKVAKDGSKTEILANGFRAANGVCLNPDGTFFVTDQEGHWTPKNRINLVKPNAQKPPFYGNYMGYHDKSNKDSEMEEPLVWLTQKYDRSPAELLWVDSDHWGPLKGSLLNISYGFGRIYVVPHEKVDGVAQGGVSALRIPDLPSGAMRGRFHPVDGQLYTAGLFAWASSRQDRPGGFWRIRYTGSEVMQPTDLKVSKEGIKIRFSTELDSAQNFKDLKVVTWHIERSGRYGSKHQNQKELKINSVKLLDKNTVLIGIKDVQPTRGMEILGSILSTSGKKYDLKISNTVNMVK